MYKKLLFSSLLLRQQTATSGAVPKQLNNKNVIVCTFCAKNMALNGIFRKYIIKKMEKQARKVSFWVNEPFETRKGFETPVKSVDRLLALAFEVISKKYYSAFENPGFYPRSNWILSAEIQIYSDDQCAAVKSFWKKISKNVLNLKKNICQNPLVKTAWKWRL